MYVYMYIRVSMYVKENSSIEVENQRNNYQIIQTYIHTHIRINVCMPPTICLKREFSYQ